MKSLKFTLLLMAAATVTLFSSCNNDDYTSYIQKNKVLILNQGNYTEQNSSVYVYDEDTKEITPNAYSRANNGTKLGATLMSGTFAQTGAGYLLCANPDKIETIDLLTIKTLGNSVVDGLENPREIITAGSYLFVSNAGNAYIDLGNGYREYTESFVSIYNIGGYIPTFVTSIEVGSDAQGMAYMNNTLFVATKDGIVTIEKEGGNFVKAGTYKDSKYTGAVKYLCIDNDLIYASVPDNGGIFALDAYNGRTAEHYEMPLSYDGYITGDLNGNIYTYATKYAADWSVESSNVYKLNVNNGSVSTVAVGDNMFSVGISPYSSNLFYSEANGFITNSTMTVKDIKNESQVASKTTGVGTFRYLFFSYLDIAATTPAN